MALEKFGIKLAYLVHLSSSLSTDRSLFSLILEATTTSSPEVLRTELSQGGHTCPSSFMDSTLLEHHCFTIVR